VAGVTVRGVLAVFGWLWRRWRSWRRRARWRAGREDAAPLVSVGARGRGLVRCVLSLVVQAGVVRLVLDAPSFPAGVFVTTRGVRFELAGSSWASPLVGSSWATSCLVVVAERGSR
jgi:hypothetical protein